MSNRTEAEKRLEEFRNYSHDDDYGRDIEIAMSLEDAVRKERGEKREDPDQAFKDKIREEDSKFFLGAMMFLIVPATCTMVAHSIESAVPANYEKILPSPIESGFKKVSVATKCPDLVLEDRGSLKLDVKSPQHRQVRITENGFSEYCP